MQDKIKKFSEYVDNLNKRWISLDLEFFGSSTSDEISYLFWCGGNTYAIVYLKLDLDYDNVAIKQFYIGLDTVKIAWRLEKNYYENLKNF